MNLNIGNIGVWGFRHYKFLKQNRPSTVGVMRMSEKTGFCRRGLPLRIIGIRILFHQSLFEL